MKICIFIDDITHTGGIERVTSNLISQFTKDRSDLEIDIVSQFKSGDKLWYPFDNCQIKYLSEKNYDAKPHSFERMTKMLSNVLTVRKYFKKNHYDIIIGQSFPNVFVLYLAGVNMNNVIAAEHVYYNYYSNLIKTIRLHIYKNCARVAVLTSLDKACYDKHYAYNHTVLIPNPVVVPEYHQSQLEDKIVIAMGRIQYQKGFDILVDVFSLVNHKHPDWKCYIYGDGNLRREVEDCIIKKGMQDVVILKGRTDNVPNAMREASMFVLSSRFEGFGMVIAEAMAQGLPAVSFDCPTGPSDIVRTGYNGILVKNQDKQALANAICNLIEHPEDRKQMGINAIQTSKEFAGNVVAEKWYKLFAEISPN
ncbi:glycosyltransferase family 4 protein [Segatella copri]|uniref:glycosyltransferase family 4 protein n=1 Tax=Segatella copri TaxID=165179 RepID=UPI003F8AA081